jgi:hypothetical protein
MEAGNPVNPHIVCPLIESGSKAFGGIVEQTATNPKQPYERIPKSYYYRRMNL